MVFLTSKGRFIQKRKKGTDFFCVFSTRNCNDKSGVCLEPHELVITGYPHHIIQRAHNRQVVFAADELRVL
jgi:hypothetical protein